MISGLRSQAACEPTLLTSTVQPSPPVNHPPFFLVTLVRRLSSFSSICNPHIRDMTSTQVSPPPPLSLSPTLFFLLCSPSRRCALRRRAGCRRQTGPWRRRWTGRPQAPWQTTPGRCSWRGASPLLSGSGSNPQPQLSPPGGRSKEGRKKNNQQQHRTKRSTQQSQSQYKELQVVHAFLLMEVSPRLFCSQITSAIFKACFAMLNSSLVQWLIV